MADTDKTYLLKELTRTIDESDSTAALCLCQRWILKDALALLKEQKPVRVGKKIKAGDVVLDFYQCGHCKNAIRKHWRYCPFCGKTVKWE